MSDKITPGLACLGHEPMTEERLAEIREREQAATEGPWGTNGRDDPGCDVEHATGFALAYMAANYYRKRGVEQAEQRGVACQLGTLVADARFMAAARTDVPDLLAEVDQLNATLDRVRKRAEQWAALAPADDWGDTTTDTLTADHGRAILADLDQPGGTSRG